MRKERKEKKERGNRLIATIMALSYSVMLLPAQELGINMRSGQTQLEQYLDRAQRERSSEDWERIAEDGILSALAEWESANSYLKEKDFDEWESERSEASAYYETEKERGYVEWYTVRLYEEKAKLRESDLLEDIQAKARDWEYENLAGEKTQIVGLSEADLAYGQWSEELDEVLAEYMENWEKESGIVVSELANRVGGGGTE